MITRMTIMMRAAITTMIKVIARGRDETQHRALQCVLHRSANIFIALIARDDAVYKSSRENRFGIEE
jgi:hypothetical protein